jgi:hypothetical protein
MLGGIASSAYGEISRNPPFSLLFYVVFVVRSMGAGPKGSGTATRKSPISEKTLKNSITTRNSQQK